MAHYKIFSPFQCSDAFYRATCIATRSTSLYCEACRRTLCSDPATGDYEFGEYEDLKRKAMAEPDGYVFFSEGINSLGFFYFGNIQVALDCPCNYARFIEDMDDGKDGTPSIIIPPFLPNKKLCLY